MPNIAKPVDINKVWSSGGDILDPGDTKIATGWQVEIPPRQWFNYIDNKQDQSIAHINQHGIAVWDAVTEYQGNLSYVQGSDGIIYKCLVTNSNINPVGYTGSNWRAAFYSVDPLATQLLQTNGFKKYADGYMEAWGYFTTDPSTQTSAITFAAPFLEPPYSITGSHYGGGGAMFVVKVNTNPVTATGFTALVTTVLNGVGTGSFSGSYVAKGRWK